MCWRAPLVLVCGLLLAPACGFVTGGGSSDDGDGGDSTGADSFDPTEALPMGQALEGCRGGASDEMVADQTAIVGDFRDSMHELVICGGLTVRISAAVIEALVTLIVEQVASAMPEEFTYMGVGVYRTGNVDTGTDMQLTFAYGDDYVVGKKGESIEHDLFVLESYLVGATAELDVQAQVVRISYDSPGPLVELMGLGAQPANPIEVGLADTAKLTGELRKLLIAGPVVVDDARTVATVAYDVNIGPSPVASLVGVGGSLAYALVDAGAERATPAQTLDVTEFAMSFTDQGQQLDGYVRFTARGGLFDFDGAIDYAAGGDGVVGLVCPP